MILYGLNCAKRSNKHSLQVLGKLEHGPNPHSGMKGKVYDVGVKGGARIARVGLPVILGTLFGGLIDTARQWNRDRTADDIMTRAEWEERQRGK